MYTFPAEAEPGDTRSHFSPHTVNRGPFPGLFSATFFTFLCFIFPGDFMVESSAQAQC